MDMKKLLPTTMLLNILRGNPSLLQSYIRGKILYVVNIDGMFWNYRTTFEKLFKNGRRNIDLYSPTDDESVLTYQLDSGTCEYVDVIWFKNKPIILRKEHNDGSEAVQSNSVVLITFNTKPFVDNLHEFLTTLYHNGPKLDSPVRYKDINVVRTYAGDNAQSRNIPLDTKTFDDVFLPDDQYKALIDGIDNYIKSRPLLEEHHIPNHLGILLYGTPGCGRTSIIKALIHKYNVHSYYLPSLDMLPATVSSFCTRLHSDNLTFVICEDVDCILFNRQKEYKRKDEDRNNHLKDEVSISQVLNCIDGICAPHNTVFIFTTNHIEELDPALIRPGRMDIRLEIKPICYETLNKFTRRFYGKDLPSDYVCREGELFSNLQLQFMAGATFEDILKFMKGA